jgi:predicted cupin superfamily sugar epimerase
MNDPDQIIKELQLTPLEGEGGLWASIFRSEGASAIYFMMRDPDFSAWHRIPESETWIHLAGSPTLLYTFEKDPDQADLDGLTSRTLDNRAGNYLYTVKPLTWMAAKPLGDWSLLVCTLAPAFTAMELASKEDVMRWASIYPKEIGELCHG